ncbi:MAG: single-stranded-DNA-specific exonuclease RecJ [Patescibacteria group bacterium]
MSKIWKIKPKISKESQNNFPEINPVVLQLLYNRGLSNQEAIDEFLNPDYSQDVHDPFLFQDMQKAVDRIVKAVSSEKKIVVHGDYDADGVSASAVLVEVLRKLGIKQENLYIYIPHRNTEGYGLSEETVNNLVKSKTDLIITADCGISNVNEVNLAQQKGIDVIITDHHTVPSELPKSFAIINPKVKSDKYPFAELSGVGVAFKLVQALRRHQKIEGGFEKWLLDLVALGTVADSVPLLGENRTLVKYGLIVLNKTRRLGLRRLYSVARIELGEINARSISFQIAPRLNAAGRLEHANTAYQLLISEEKQATEDLANQLNNTNFQRQQITDSLKKEAFNQIGDKVEDLVIFVHGQDQRWQPGIIGLIAGRVSDQYFRPAFVICQQDNLFIGSGRSIEQLDIMEVLADCRQYLQKFGGHAQACGFTLEGEANLEGFKKMATEIINQKLQGQDLRPQIEIESAIRLSDIDWDLFEELDNFSPFGEGNRQPIFLTKQVKLDQMEKVGADKRHLRLALSQGSKKFHKTIGFGMGDWADKLKLGDTVDVVYTVDVNEWNGNRELQLKLIDIKPNG